MRRKSWQLETSSVKRGAIANRTCIQLADIRGSSLKSRPGSHPKLSSSIRNSWQLVFKLCHCLGWSFSRETSLGKLIRWSEYFCDTSHGAVPWMSNILFREDPQNWWTGNFSGFQKQKQKFSIFSRLHLPHFNKSWRKSCVRPNRRSISPQPLGSGVLKVLTWLRFNHAGLTDEASRYKTFFFKCCPFRLLACQKSIPTQHNCRPRCCSCKRFSLSL